MFVCSYLFYFVVFFVEISSEHNLWLAYLLTSQLGHNQLTHMSDLLISWCFNKSVGTDVSCPADSPQLNLPYIHCICCIFSTHSCATYTLWTWCILLFIHDLIPEVFEENSLQWFCKHFSCHISSRTVYPLNFLFEILSLWISISLWYALYTYSLRFCHILQGV